MFSEPTELLWIGCLIESFWTPRSKSNTFTKKTNSQINWPREISHVMNGIMFCVCLTLATSVLQLALAKRVQQESREERVTAKSRPMMNLVSSTASESPVTDMKVNNPWAHGMSSIKEQGDFQTLTHQITQSGILTRIGLLNNVNLMNWWK